MDDIRAVIIAARGVMLDIEFPVWHMLEKDAIVLHCDETVSTLRDYGLLGRVVDLLAFEHQTDQPASD